MQGRFNIAIEIVEATLTGDTPLIPCSFKGRKEIRKIEIIVAGLRALNRFCNVDVC